MALGNDPIRSALKVKGQLELIIIPLAGGAAGFDQLA